ncbi:MAG: class I SAM-dependent methyltransferase, partial [Candidatus Caenarcaniphilales bacterium]|nr:class I SAM-dependent methyltransferase [Candidatus Caenarcaniphilales bacterium]
MNLIETNKDKFDKLYELYSEYNSHTNISAIRDKDSVYKKHFEDSLVIAPYITQKLSIVDIGTGGGFPALPLAICFPKCKITAVDSIGKKTKFIDLVKDELKLN